MNRSIQNSATPQDIKSKLKDATIKHKKQTMFPLSALLLQNKEAAMLFELK